MKPDPIAMIPYANMAPFQQMGPPEGCEFVECLPRHSIEALHRKKVLAAAVPVGGLAQLSSVVESLGLYGIAVQSHVMSVLLFTDRPFERFHAPLTIGLTGESASSIRLVYLLLGYQHGFDMLPTLAGQGESSHGCLVIGDRALSWAREFDQAGSVRGYDHVTDLAVRWYAHCGLPFVFARWVVHREAPAAFKDLLRRWLHRFSTREAALIEQSVSGVARRLGLPEDYVKRYLKVIRRCLTSEDDAGQSRFMQEWQRHGSDALFQSKP